MCSTASLNCQLLSFKKMSSPFCCENITEKALQQSKVWKDHRNLGGKPWRYMEAPQCCEEAGKRKHFSMSYKLGQATHMQVTKIPLCGFKCW